MNGYQWALSMLEKLNAQTEGANVVNSILFRIPIGRNIREPKKQIENMSLPFSCLVEQGMHRILAVRRPLYIALSYCKPKSGICFQCCNAVWQKGLIYRAF